VSAPAPPTIVSLTPLPLDRDSRTFRIASAFARFGWRSVVVENLASASAAPGVTTLTLGGSRLRGNGRAARRGNGIGHFLAFVAAYFVARPLEVALRVPRADLYYLHEYRLYPAVALARLLRPAPLIYDAHDFYPESESEASRGRFWRRLFKPLLGWMERRCIAAADAVVTVSDGVARLIESHYGVRPRVLPNLHDSRLDEAVERDIRRVLELTDDDFLAVSVGNAKQDQPLEPLAQAVARLPARVHVAFVGRGYDGLGLIARRFGAAGRLHAAGAIEPWRIVPFIATADAALLLYLPNTRNFENAFPNKVFQYLAAGLPVFYSALPEVARTIGTSGAGVAIDPGDAECIRAALLALTDDAERATRMAAAAAELSSRFRWQDLERDLKALAESLMRH